MNTYFALFVIALVVSFIATPVIRNIALKLGLVDQPGARRLHDRPIPRLGGIAIVGAFLVALIVVLQFDTIITAQFNDQLGRIGRLMGPSLLIVLVGIYDDIAGVHPKVKFVAQAIAASLLYAGGYRIEAIGSPLGGTVEFGYLALPITILWVVGLSNAFNLIDGIDGLSAGAAFFATVTLSVVALANDQSIVVVLSLALSGAILGFLKYNFNPATIFMGDSGSLFVGFLLAALAIEGSQKSSTVVAIAIPVVSFGLPILETVLSMLRRFLAGKPIFLADREHIHHMLIERGLTMRQAAIILYAVSAGFSLFALLFLYPNSRIIGLVLFVLGVFIWIGIQHLGYPEFNEMGRLMQRGVNQRQVIANNIRLRRITADLSRATDIREIMQAIDSFMEIGEFSHLQVKLKNSSSVDWLLTDSMPPARLNGFLKWEWNAPHSGLDVEKSSRYWLLRLPLASTEDESQGEVLLYRELGRQQMMLDINLISDHFYPALGNAFVRIVWSSAPVQERIAHGQKAIRS